MTGWCLLLVCLGAALVQVDGDRIDEYVRQKAAAFFHNVADRDRDGIFAFQDYTLISRYVETIPGYTKFNVSYLIDVIDVEVWAAFPGREMNLSEFLATLEAIDPVALKNALDILTSNIFSVWDFLDPPNCLTYEEIKWLLINIGKYNNVDDQARLAVAAMDKDKDKTKHKECITLAEYQECAYDYLTVTDLNHDSKYFFGYLEGL